MSEPITRRELDDAAVIAQMVAASPMAEVGEYPSCIQHHDCPSCTCSLACGHRDVAECVASAIGASDLSLRAYYATGNLISEFGCDWLDDLADPGGLNDPARWRALRKWRESIGITDDRWCVSSEDEGIETAGLLADGVIPFGFRLSR